MKSLKEITDEDLIILAEIFGFKKEDFCKTSHSAVLLNGGNPILRKNICDNGTLQLKGFNDETLFNIFEDYFKLCYRRITTSDTSFEYRKAIDFLIGKNYKLK